MVNYRDTKIDSFKTKSLAFWLRFYYETQKYLLLILIFVLFLTCYQIIELTLSV